MALPAQIKGYVRDANGVGLVGAGVACGGITVKTIAGGVYLMTVAATGTKTVTGSMAGYVSASVSVTLSSGATAAAPLITLRKI